jgi:hypothetical protein
VIDQPEITRLLRGYGLAAKEQFEGLVAADLAGKMNEMQGRDDAKQLSPDTQWWRSRSR